MLAGALASAICVTVHSTAASRKCSGLPPGTVKPKALRSPLCFAQWRQIQAHLDRFFGENLNHVWITFTTASF